MSLQDLILNIAKGARDASRDAARLGSAVKNNALLAMAQGIEKNSAFLKKENSKDLELAGKKGLQKAMLERLCLSDKTIKRANTLIHET